MLTAQNVRLIDVLLLGPFMIWFGLQSSGPEWAKCGLIIAGILTASYNWDRYQKARLM